MSTSRSSTNGEQSRKKAGQIVDKKSFMYEMGKLFNQFYQDEFLSGARICLDLPELPREFRNLSNSFWSRKSFSEEIYQKISDALE